MTDEKTCKHCAMMIPKKAKICPYCRKKQGSTLLTVMVGFFFFILFIGAIRENTTPNGEQDQNFSTRPSILRQITDSLQTSKQEEQRMVNKGKSSQPIPPNYTDIHIQALDFVNAYGNSERINKQFEGRAIVITGKISNIFIPPPSVRMKMAKEGLSANAFIYFSDKPVSDVTETLIGNGVSCYLDESLEARASQMHRGQTITLRCKYKGEKTLDECTFAYEKRPILNEEQTTSRIAGTWKGALKCAGYGKMEIKPTSTGFDISLVISGGQNTGTPCAGSIEGSGTLSGNTLTLSKKEDDMDDICTITIKFAGDTANIDEDYCGYYHGAACGFCGTLKKMN